MHVETGQIHELSTLQPNHEQRRELERLAARTDRAEEKQRIEAERQLQAVKDFEAGKIVPVSDLVAQKVKLGERELRRRARRRQRDARKRNRSR